MGVTFAPPFCRNGVFMINTKDIERIRAQIEKHIGSAVKITVRKGRKKIVVRYGVIKSVYPYTFNVTLESISEFAETKRSVSLNYSDILTGMVTLLLTESDNEIK